MLLEKFTRHFLTSVSQQLLLSELLRQHWNPQSDSVQPAQSTLHLQREVKVTITVHWQWGTELWALSVLIQIQIKVWPDLGLSLASLFYNLIAGLTGWWWTRQSFPKYSSAAPELGWTRLGDATRCSAETRGTYHQHHHQSVWTKVFRETIEDIINSKVMRMVEYWEHSYKSYNILYILFMKIYHYNLYQVWSHSITVPFPCSWFLFLWNVETPLN